MPPPTKPKTDFESAFGYKQGSNQLQGATGFAGYSVCASKERCGCSSAKKAKKGTGAAAQ